MIARLLPRVGLISTLLLSQNLGASYREDHPLISAYPGAAISYAQMIDYERFALPVSVVDVSKKPADYKKLERVGDLYRHTYDLKNVSSLKVYENYLSAAKQLGAKPLYSCALDACGDPQAAQTLGSLLAISGSVYNSYHNPYYWVGELDGAKGKILLAWFVGAYESQVSIQQVIIETEAPETHLVKVDARYASQAPTATSLEPLSEKDKAEDHPLLPRYPGARIYQHKKVDTETATLPYAITSAKKAPLALTGDLARHTYTLANVSTLKVYENYKTALTQAGFVFESQCELNQCGSAEQAKALGNPLALAGNVFNWYHKPYYLLAKKPQAGSTTYVALFIGGYEAEVAVQQVIVEEKQVQTGLVTVNADQLKQQLDTDGKALIYGIYFDTGKAEVKPESKPTLEAISQLLTRHTDLLLYVVGHTDDVGEGAANVTLSRRRADAVVATLVKTYKVAPARLQAQGVGPYAPTASNTSEAGKQKNRRVELVKRLR